MSDQEQDQETGVEIEEQLDLPRTIENDTPEIPEDTVRSAMERAEARMTADGKDAGDKPEPEEAPAKKEKPAKEEAEPEEKKPAKAEKEPEEDEGEPEEEEEPKPEKKERKQPRDQAPARFVPEARDKWVHAPREVRAEVSRIMGEYEADAAKMRDATDRYEAVREYDERARQNGGDLRQSLERMDRLEQAMQQNPLQAINEIIQGYGPRKADGSAMGLMDIVNYAAQQGPERMQAALRQQQAGQPRQPQMSMEQIVQATAQQVLRETQREQSVREAQGVLDRFAQDHPDIQDPAMQKRLENILTKGIIEDIYGTGLSQEQKLIEAYRMAGGRIASTPLQAEADADDHPRAPVRTVNPAGRKSVSGAPTRGSDKPAARKVAGSVREAMERAEARIRSS